MSIFCADLTPKVSVFFENSFSGIQIAEARRTYITLSFVACGLPSAASPVGVNAEFVEHGVNGSLASTDQEWRKALSTLLADPELRLRMGLAGRKKIEEYYSLQVWGPRVAELLRGVIEKPQNG